jgi:hypothetical protein
VAAVVVEATEAIILVGWAKVRAVAIVWGVTTASIAAGAGILLHPEAEKM